jgi:diacylglycerol kinase (ATP)
MVKNMNEKKIKDDTETTKQNGAAIVYSFDCAIKGIVHAFKTQRSLRIHFLIALIVLIMSLFINLNRNEFIMVIFTISFVFITEILNTVVEFLLDFIKRDYNPVIRSIKDMSAGMVMIASVNAVIVGYLIFFKKEYFGQNMTIPLLIKIKNVPEHIVVISLVIISILTIAGKSLFRKGSPLHGGMPSFHSAFAFGGTVMVAFITQNIILTGLTMIMAVIIAESRFREGIHTRFEILMGAILGVLITVLMFQVFGG